MEGIATIMEIMMGGTLMVTILTTIKLTLAKLKMNEKKRLSKKDNKRCNAKKPERTEEQKKRTQSLWQKEGLG